jgi:HEAT repeat protein
MAKRLSTQEKLAKLGKLVNQPLSEDGIKEIKKALASANNLVAAKAAQVAAQCQLIDLIPQLISAFERFMEKAVKSDKGCFAKTALVEALDTMETREYAPFLQGIRHVQMEPVYGGHEDTAANLRARCALALARCEYPDIFFELTPLLTDPEPQARIAAIKALTYLNEEKSELLLRLKTLTGDKEPQVLSECFSGLMTIAPARSLSFVAGFLEDSDLLIAEGAALALGETREIKAFNVLQDLWEDSIDSEVKEMLLLPMALTRCDEAFKYLLDIVACEYQGYAAAAVKALKVYADNDVQREKIRGTVASRRKTLISETYTREFGDE